MNRLISVLGPLSIVLLLSFSVQAQDNYIEALGVRGGPVLGLSYKRFIDVPIAIEGIVGIELEDDQLWSFTGLYEYHIYVNPELNLIGGAGLTMAFDANDFNLLGDVLLGIEYTFLRFPLTLQADYKPAYNIFKNKFLFELFGITVRYTIK